LEAGGDQITVSDQWLLKKFEELSGRLSLVEQANVSLQEREQQHLQRIEQLVQENRLLRQKLDHFIQRYFGGKRNESLDRQQLEMLLQGLELTELPVAAAPARPPATAPRPGVAHPVRRVLASEHLETRETVIEPEEVKAQPEGWRKLSEERTTLLDYEPGKFFKQVTVRPRYVKHEEFAVAPLPPQPIEQSMAGPGLLAHVVVTKFEEHTPLYRLERIFRQQHGVELSRKTMGDWVFQIAELVKPVYQAIAQELQQCSYLQADETPIRCLDPDVKGKSVKGFLWVYGEPKGDVLFDWRMGRGREGPAEFLKNFRGTLQTDAYGVYESLAKAREGELTLAGCLAHGRRGFKDAIAENKVAAWFVKQMALLYAVEQELRRSKAGPQLRAAVRQHQSAPVMARLRKAMEIIRRKTLPQGLLGQAIDYMLVRWESFTRFLEDGRVELDNNLIENAIRPTAIGKKNWLFIGAPEAGQRSAIIYTLLGNCRRHGVNPYEYFRDIIARLPAAKITQIKEFTPSAWANAQRKNQPAQKVA
jgi:transposase